MFFVLGISEEEMQQRLYGPEGWTLDSGVWNVVSRSEPSEIGAIANGKPTTHYVRFNRLGSAGAQTLLDNLPAEALKERQNCGPELEGLLKACAAHQDKVLLSGSPSMQCGCLTSWFQNWKDCPYKSTTAETVTATECGRQSPNTST